MTEQTNIQALPPQDIEAEQAVLGAVLVDSRLSIGRSVLRPEDFYKTSHRAIWAAMQRLRDRREEIDLVTLTAELRKGGPKEDLEAAGGASYLSALVSQVPSGANFDAHERIVLNMSQLRSALYAAMDAQRDVYAHPDPDTLISGFIARLNGIRRMAPGEIVPYREIIDRGYRSIEERSKNPGKLTGIPTGFHGIDRMTNGWQKGWKYVVAGRPGMGKTALAMQMARAAAASGYPVGVISLEMTDEQLALRDISAESGVPLSRLLAGTVHGEDWDLLPRAAARLYGLPIHCAFSAYNAEAEARIIDDLVLRHGARALFIDYLQLQKILKHLGNREQEVAAISGMHKRKAKEHKIPVIELSQLNREVERRSTRKPTLSDLRESGSIEQDADFVGFIWGEECKCPKSVGCSCGNRHRRYFSGAKGRMNEIGDVELAWNEQKTVSFREVVSAER